VSPNLKPNSHTHRRACGVWLAAAVVLTVTVQGAWAARPPAPKHGVGAKTSAQKKQYTEKTVSFMTSDGVYIYGTYYPSDLGREAPVVICLHQRFRDRRDFIQLARFLQMNGFAVLTLDLRGHGESKSVNADVYRFHWKKGVQRIREHAAEAQLLNAKRFARGDYERMVRDVEAGKRFLIGENNEGRLNLGKLAVVGASIGATAAIRHAAYDWQFPKPKGQDVNALVLLSPGYRYQGVSIAKAIGQIATRIPILTIAGIKDSQSYSSAQRIDSLTKRGGSQLSAFKQVKTSLHGIALLGSDFRTTLYKLMIKWLKLAVNDIVPPPRWQKREVAPQHK
jgi:pimeloyl-ACP methyl ester carboxylesterase